MLERSSLGNTADAQEIMGTTIDIPFDRLSQGWNLATVRRAMANPHLDGRRIRGLDRRDPVIIHGFTELWCSSDRAAKQQV
jgi:hypothetical protein